MLINIEKFNNKIGDSSCYSHTKISLISLLHFFVCRN